MIWRKAKRNRYVILVSFLLFGIYKTSIGVTKLEIIKAVNTTEFVSILLSNSAFQGVWNERSLSSNPDCDT